MFRSLRTLRSIPRLKDIAFVLARHGFHQVAGRLQAPVTAQLRRLFRREPAPVIQQPERLRMVLEDLGPTFIKFGQLLSTRPDLLPTSYVLELARLQDEVQPAPFPEIQERLREEFGGRVEELFRSVDPVPLATASIAQVHRAVTASGDAVVIKVRKEGLERVIEQDLHVLGLLAEFLRDWPGWKLFDPEGVLRVFERTIRRELNFDYERNSLLLLRKRLPEDSCVYIPRPYPELSTTGVLTMEYLEGEKLSAYRGREVPPGQGERVATDLSLEILRQIFEDGQFHADPHPGNVILMTDGRIGLIDVGSIGRLTKDIMDDLVVLLISVVRRDYRGMARWILAQGRHQSEIDRQVLSMDLMDQLEPYYGLSLDEIRVGELFNSLFGIVLRHGIQVPSQFVLVGRTLVTLEGAIRLCAPELDVLRQLEPYVARLLRERYAPRRVFREIESQFGELAGSLRRLPVNLAEVVTRAAEGRLRVESSHPELEKIENKLDAMATSIPMAMVVSALLLSSTALLCFGGGGRMDYLSWLLGGAGLVAALLVGLRLTLRR